MPSTLTSEVQFWQSLEPVLSAECRARGILLDLHMTAAIPLARALAEHCDLTAWRQAVLLVALRWHDVGQWRLSWAPYANRLLTDEEWRLMRMHPIEGYRILARYPGTIARRAANIALGHHWRYDGGPGGYPPCGPIGEDIAIETRIVTVCDLVSAASGMRPYRAPKSATEVCLELEMAAGGQVDPELAKVAIQLLS